MTRTGFRQRVREDGPVVVTLLAGLAYHNRILWSQFYGFVFAFHDLALINDWFSNAIYRGRPFWISAISENHLSVHFTPSWILLTPFYLLTDSQYLLLALGTIAVALALYIGHRFWMRLAAVSVPKPGSRALLSAVLVAFLFLNLYTRTVLQSAHCEVFFVPAAMGALYCLMFSEPAWKTVLCVVLAVGMRAEAGMYLASQCLGLAFASAGSSPVRDLRRRAAVMAGAAMSYVVIVVKVVIPGLFGNGDLHVKRFWSQWGNTWTEVFLAMAMSPGRLLSDLADSALPRINASFGFLLWLNPLYATVVNLPGILLYGSSAVDKRYLWYYNASFLLSGFFLGTMLGVERLARGMAVASERGPGTRKVIFCCAALALAAITWNSRHDTAEAAGGYALRAQPQASLDAERIRLWAARCPTDAVVATDFRHIVYVPGRVERFLLDRAGAADLVLIFRGADSLLSGKTTSEELWRLFEEDARYALLDEDPTLRVYGRVSGPCR